VEAGISIRFVLHVLNWYLIILPPLDSSLLFGNYVAFTKDYRNIYLKMLGNWENLEKWFELNDIFGLTEKCIFYLQRILFDSLMIICRWCANLVTVINGPLVPLFFRKLELTFPFIEGTEGDNMRGDGCRSIIIHLPVRCTTSKLSCCLILFYGRVTRF
jgi:hypothetical protein